MRKMLLVSALGMSALSLSAQTKFYISGWGGMGKSGKAGGIYSMDLVSIRTEPDKAYNGGLSIGAEVKRWRVEAGLQYSTTGYTCSTLQDLNILPDPAPGSTWSVTYSYLSIPIRVGYVGSVSKKLRVIPMATLMTSYNTGSKVQGEIPETYQPVARMTKEIFDAEYGSLSLWGGLGVNFEYSISDNISAFAGPAFQFMLTGSDHPHSMGLNLGIRYEL